MTNVVVELIIEITWFGFGQSDFPVRLNDKTDKQMILLNANMHGILDHFSLDFKLLYLWLEVVMRFKALGNGSNKCCVVNITSHYH